MVNKQRFINQFIPANSCLLCAGEHNERLVCQPCLADLVRLGDCCPVCAIPLPITALCPACLRRPPPYTAQTIFRYEYPLSLLIQRLKFRGHASLGHILGELMLSRFQEQQPLPDCLVPMPLHWRRQLWRGFNQALELARPLARGLDLPLRTDLCRRRHATRPQTNLPSSARRTNVHNVFTTCLLTMPAHVAIIDDVLTSGQTAAELARVLKRAGVQHVQVWTLARAGLHE